MSPSVISAEILPFRLQPLAANRLTARDRIEMLQWEQEAYAHGFTRLELDTSAPDGCSELGDFVSLYRGDSGWASWGVGCCRGGFTVWRPATGETVGWYPQLRQALASTLAAEQPTHTRRAIAVAK